MMYCNKSTDISHIVETTNKKRTSSQWLKQQVKLTSADVIFVDIGGEILMEATCLRS